MSPDAAAPAGGADVVLLWHMHQPDYRDPRDGSFRLPWVLLHATKDYADMAAHLEVQPGMRAVVSFVPVLLDQIDDYVDQFATGRFRDPLLVALARPDGAPLGPALRQRLLGQCFAGNPERLIAPFPAYARLHAIALAAGPDAPRWLDDAFVDDALVWHLLAWTGETVRRASGVVQRLIAQGSAFGAADRHALLAEIAAVVTGLVDRYRALADVGRIELATSPAHHPIGPLLLDFGAAREARPDLPLPARDGYPGGAQRLDLHLDAAFASHARRFGAQPAGVWPPEGAVSDAFVRSLGARGVRWFASGSQVLDNSLARAALDVPPAARLRGWRLPFAPALTGFFRDDRLSDLIGFEYRNWHGSDAVAHFVAQLEAAAADAPRDVRPTIAVIVDGENAWEYYPYNGFFFLSELYAALAAHPGLRPRTFRDLVNARDEALGRGADDPAAPLPALVAGSWVYGDLTTWIGHADKNRAWELLADAKRACDEAMARGGPDAAAQQEMSRLLAVCEASDWFWWFGDHQPADAVASFDALFRDALRRLYALAGLAAPAALDVPVSLGNATAAHEGAILRATAEKAP